MRIPRPIFTIRRRRDPWRPAPLDHVRTARDAATLAGIWAGNAADQGLGRDGYVYPQATTVLSWYLYAAALRGEPVATAAGWLAAPDVADPADILDAAGESDLAGSVRAMMALGPQPRAAVYATAALMCRVGSTAAPVVFDRAGDYADLRTGEIVNDADPAQRKARR